MKDKMAAIEYQMKAKLAEIRATFNHSGDKGTSIENLFREFLRKYLPRRLEIGNGEIIDSGGQKSKQTDLVIVNEDHPFTFTPDLPGLFFIEGVCAAGEVKANLTSTEFKKALEDSCQFKQLNLNPGKGTTVLSNASDINRFYKCPPWFLLSFESQLTFPAIRESIMEFMEHNVIADNRLVDGVFVLNRGWLINFGDGKGSFQFRTPKGESLKGWIWQPSDLVISDLLGWLSVVMPKMIRYAPILPQYILRRYGEDVNG